MTGAEIASTAIGSLGLVLALVSLNWQRRVARREQHEQREPRIDAFYDFADGDEFLYIANNGPVDLMSVHLAMRPAGAGEQVLWIDSHGEDGVTIRDLAIGATKLVNLARDSTGWSSGTIRLRIDCTAGKGESWTLVRDVRHPSYPR
jgi:hypothetical protein